MKTRNSLWLSALALSLFCAALLPRQASAQIPTIVYVLATDPFAAEEGSEPATFTVIRLGPLDAPLTVQYALGGTAVNGDDYQTLSGEVTIPQGQITAPVVVSPIDDFLVEGWEDVVLALQQPPVWPPPYIVVWPSVAVAHIEDNDYLPTNQPPHVAIANPPDGAAFQAPVDIPLVARAFDPDGRVVSVEFFDGNQSLGVVSNSFSTPPRDPIEPVLTPVDPAFDVEPELYPGLDANPSDPAPNPWQLFRLVWTNVPPGHHRLTAVATDNDGANSVSAPVGIEVLPAPPQPVVCVTAIDPEAAEPNPTTDRLDTATFRIKRTGGTDLPLTVFYRLGGTASNGVDYAELPHRAVIAAGERFVDVVVEPLDDSLVEGDESVIIVLAPSPACADDLSSPDCYELCRCHAARAVIHDNDTPPNLPPLVRIVRPEDGTVFVAPVDIPIVAMARDLDGRVETVEFFEGTNSLGIVTNNNITLTNTRPPFMIVWSNVPPGHYVLHAVATDNDGASGRSKPVEIKVVTRPRPPAVNIEATDPIASEPGPLTVVDPAVFTVTRTGNTQYPLRVHYAIGGTASNGVDYFKLSGEVTIPAGSGETNIVVIPRDDNLLEGPETVVLKLQPPLCLSLDPAPIGCYYVIGPSNAARAVIRDNDFPPTNHPPRVAILRPEEGDMFEAFSDIPIYAAAADPDGYVRSVEFFEGTNSLGIVTNSLSATGTGSNDWVGSIEQIFRLIWRNVPPGGYTLTAKATDNRGASAISEPVHIRVSLVRPPVVTIEATDPYASEGQMAIDGGPSGTTGPTPIPIPPDTATFTVYRRGNTNNDLTVFYELGGTAQNGEDYRPLSGQVTIPRGAHRARVVVDPIDDRLHEDTETVIAKLRPVLCPALYPPPPGCYVVGEPNRAVAYIRDNDPNLSPRVEIVEPPDNAVFRAGADIKIGVVARDPDGWVTKVEFFEGTNRIGVQEIFYIVPPPPGQVQTFSMVWSNVPAGRYMLAARATDDLGAVSRSDSINVHVFPDIRLPVVIIEAVDRVGSEQDPRLLIPPDPAVFKVSRHGGDFSQPLKVYYRVSGTASNGLDYRPLSGEVEIPQNEASAPIVVEVIDDNLVEGPETVVLALVQPPCALSNAVPVAGCYVVGWPGRDIAYIRDNDSPPNRPPKVALINPPNGSVFEAPADIRLIAAAEDPDGWVATVEFFAGTNSLGVVTNHPWLVDPFRLPDLSGAMVTDPAVYPIPMPNPFVLPWLNVPPGRYVLTAVATDNLGASSRSMPVEIRVLGNTDLPVVRIFAVDPIAREGTPNTAAFRVRRTGRTNDALTVFYAIRGSAQNGVDYLEIAHSVAIPAGRRSARIVITPIDDNLNERIETVILALVPPPVVPPTYQIGRPRVGAAIILDNDCALPHTESLPDRNLHVRLPLPDGLPYRIEASGDLTNWEAVASGVVTSDGLGFVEGETDTIGQRFYRVVPELEPEPDDD